MGNAGYEVSVATVDVSSREAVHALVDKATGIAEITGLIHAAGVSPSQASPETILHVDLYGTAVVLEEFGNVIARGGRALSSRPSLATGYPHSPSNRTRPWPLRLQTNCSNLPFLQLDQVQDSLHAYQLSKRGNSLPRDGRSFALGKACRASTRSARESS